VSRLLRVLAIVMLPATAAASPLGDPAIERAVFAGSTQSSPHSLELNPASLSTGSGTRIYVDGTMLLDSITIDRRTIDAAGSLADGPSYGESMWNPGGSVGIYHVGVRFAVGAALLATTPEQWAEGGDVTAYHTLGGWHHEYMGVIGGAYRWRRFSFGPSLELIDERVALRFARDTALEQGRDAVIAAGGLESPDAREVYRIDTTSGYLPGFNTVALTVGALAQVADGWWVGLSYHNPQGLFSSVRTDGTARVTRAPRDGGGTVRGDAQVRFTLPQWFRVGVRGRITDGLDLVTEARWTELSSFSQYDVRMFGLDLADAGVPEIYARPRGLRDQVTLQAGIEQVDTGQRWVLGGRVGVERGATASGKMSPLQFYPTSVTVDLAAQLRIAPDYTLQIGYGLGWAPRHDTARGAYDPLDRFHCIESGYDIDLPECRATREGYALDTASGVYGRVDNILRVTFVIAIRS
jgi:hypothetical protein